MPTFEKVIFYILAPAFESLVLGAFLYVRSEAKRLGLSFKDARKYLSDRRNGPKTNAEARRVLLSYLNSMLCAAVIVALVHLIAYRIIDALVNPPV